MRIKKNKINIYEINKYKDYIEIIIDKIDYEKIINLKTILYTITVIDSYGYIKYKSKIKSSKYLILFLIIGLFTIKFLTNIIFNIEIIHNSSEVREFVKNELKKYGIKKYKLKKTYEEIQDIKSKILNDYKDKIEWLEIENKGTKYIVRIELREIKQNNISNNKQDIIAKKDGIIKKIISKSGVSLVNVNDYVKEGDILISGDIKLNDEIKNTVKASGEVYAEVWYNVKVEYPFHYKEIKETGKTKNIFVLQFLNKNIELTFNKFKNKKIEQKNIINYFPFRIVKQKQKEINIIDEVYTSEEVINNALLKASEQISKKLCKDEYIIYQKILLINTKDSKIELEVFFSVYEEIGQVKNREE